MRKEDIVFLMEYLLSETEQADIAKMLKVRCNVRGIAHLVPHRLEKEYDRMQLLKRISYLDRLYVLGHSLQNYFMRKGISSSKVETTFHYVDTDFYHPILQKNSELTVICMGNMERDYEMLFQIIKGCGGIRFRICTGRKVFPEEFYVEILNKSKGGIQYAADALQKSFVEGIGSQREDVEIINEPYIGSYPQRYSCLYAPKGDFQYKTANGHLVHGKTLQFCNLKGYKMYDSYRVAKNALLSWMRKNEKQDCVIMVYAIYVPFLRAVINVKKKFPSVRILLIVPDLPQYMTPENTVITKLLHRMKQLLLTQMV